MQDATTAVCAVCASVAVAREGDKGATAREPKAKLIAAGDWQMDDPFATHSLQQVYSSRSQPSEPSSSCVHPQACARPPVRLRGASVHKRQLAPLGSDQLSAVHNPCEREALSCCFWQG